MVIDPVSYMLSTPRGPDMFNKRSEPYQPRSVIPPRKTLNFDWKGILPPRIPMKVERPSEKMESGGFFCWFFFRPHTC